MEEVRMIPPAAPHLDSVSTVPTTADLPSGMPKGDPATGTFTSNGNQLQWLAAKIPMWVKFAVPILVSLAGALGLGGGMTICKTTDGGKTYVPINSDDRLKAIEDGLKKLQDQRPAKPVAPKDGVQGAVDTKQIDVLRAELAAMREVLAKKNAKPVDVLPPTQKDAPIIKPLTISLRATPPKFLMAVDVPVSEWGDAMKIAAAQGLLYQNGWHADRTYADARSDLVAAKVKPPSLGWFDENWQLMKAEKWTSNGNIIEADLDKPMASVPKPSKAAPPPKEVEPAAVTFP